MMMVFLSVGLLTHETKQTTIKQKPLLRLIIKRKRMSSLTKAVPCVLVNKTIFPRSCCVR